MQAFIEEVDANFTRFDGSLAGGITDALTELAPHVNKFRDSYRRLVSLQAWRGELIQNIASPASEEFFKEAQNDALMSHHLARQGAWRVALMCLRSCIENTLIGIYYMEHPVELAQWHLNSHRLGFAEATSYLAKHPNFIHYSEQESGLQLIKNEYATLSQAVHGSSKKFRVTKTGLIEGLNVASVAELNQWASREHQTLLGLNSCLITMFKDHLAGAAQTNLRKALGLAIPPHLHAAISTRFNVRLRTAPAAA
jgi:hypothetical protein